MKKILSILVFVISVAMSSCSSEDDPKTSIKDSDVVLNGSTIELSDSWVASGETLNLTIPGIEYSSLIDNVKLTSIRIEKDGETVQSAKYYPNVSIPVKTNGWVHGKNTATVYAVFQYENEEIVKKVSTFEVIVFDELPRFEIEGVIRDDVKWVASNGEKFERYLEVESEDHKFMVPSIKWLASNGEEFVLNKINKPSFFIVEDKSNFDASIVKESLQWGTINSGIEWPETIDLDKTSFFYGEFDLKGVHEGIDIELTTTISFQIL